MPDPCPPLSALSALAAGEPSPGISSHVDGCEPCLRRLAAVRRALETDVREAAVAASSEEIDALVAELLQVPPAHRPAEANEPRFARAAVARRFSELAVDEWERDLNVALDHSHAASVIVSKLALRGKDVAELEFEIWKNRSTIHRERGETDAARASLLHAANAVRRCSDRELKQAILWYADAAICASRDVWEPHQAFALLARCEAAFRHRDPARGRAARTLRGVIHLHAGEYREALKLFNGVAADTDPADRPAHADALRNVANALIRVGRLADGEEILGQVRRADVHLGRTLQIIRDDALAAVAADVRGELETAAQGYADAHRRFAAAGEHEMALIAGKDLAIALIALNRSHEAVRVLRELLATAGPAGTDRKRFTADALAYLRDLAERQQLTLDIAANVGAYIDRIHVQRAVPFAAPMSPLIM